MEPVCFTLFFSLLSLFAFKIPSLHINRFAKPISISKYTLFVCVLFDLGLFYSLCRLLLPWFLVSVVLQWQWQWPRATRHHSALVPLHTRSFAFA